VTNFFIGVGLFALAVFIFARAFSAGFIWDDDQLLTANALVHAPDGWWRLWTEGTADYFPLMSLTLWIEYHLGQVLPISAGGALWNLDYLGRYAIQDAWNGYHIMNILFHAVVVLLTWQMLKRLRVPGAAIIAAIFAVHPVCVESVAWISERKNSIAQIFFLLSIIHYVRYEEKATKWRYVAAVICFTLSLLAKTSVVMLPFILLLLAWWRYQDLVTMRDSYELEENPTEWDTLLWSCAGAGLAVGCASIVALPPLSHLGAGIISAIARGPVFGAGLGHALVPIIVTLIGALPLGAAGYFAGLQIRKLRIWNQFWAIQVIRMIPFFLVAGVLGAITIYFQYGRAIGEEVIPIGNFWQRTCSACFGAGFYLYSALWPFNIIEIYPEWHRAFTTVELFPYWHIAPKAKESIPYYIQAIPGLAIAGLLFYCWTRRAEAWARAMVTGLGCYFLAMLPALGFLTMSYMRLTLVADHFQYISIVAVIALVVSAGYNRAFRPVWLFVAAACFALISYLNRSLTADNYVEQFFWVAGCVGLGLAMMQSDRKLWTWAWRGFLALVMLCFMFVTYNLVGNYKGEEALWSATLAKNHNTWQGHNHLGAAQYMRGDIKDAFPNFLAATQLKPENPESHNNLGLAYSYYKNMPAAIQQFETAVMIKDDSSMETNLANAYEEVGRFPDAIKTYNHALKLNPDNASAYCNMGYALMKVERVKDAIPCFMKTIELDPTMPQGRTDLSQALRMLGIDPAAPVLSGSYPFDMPKALELLRRFPPSPPQQQPQ